MADYKKLTEGERLNLVQNAILNKVNTLLDMFPGYRGYRRGVEKVLSMAQGGPNRYSASDYARDLGYSIVPFYGAYDNYVNDRPQDWKSNAVEAAFLALPINGNMRGIVGRDGKVRYVADEPIRPDRTKGAEFERLAEAQVEPYKERNIKTGEIDGPYFNTPDYDSQRLLHYENYGGKDFHYPSEYIDLETLERNYSNKSLNPENVNRTINETVFNPDERKLIERGSEEWNNVKSNADAYKEFVNDNFNNRSSLVGYSGPNPSNRTPYEIYEAFMKERGVPDKYHSLNPEETWSYDTRWVDSQARRDALDLNKDFTDYMRANNDAMRVSDYKNISKALQMNERNGLNYIEMLKDGVNKYPTNELFTEVDKRAIIKEIEERAPAIYNEPDPVRKNTMINMLINDLGGMGLWYK